MSYTFISEIREVAPDLLITSAISDSLIQNFIDDSSSYIDSLLAKYFTIPLVSLNNKTGLISGNLEESLISGINTLFTKEIFARDYIKILKTSEVLKVENILSETSLNTTTNIITSFENSEYFIIPKEISTAQKYYCTSLILTEHFSEEAYNQTAKSLAELYAQKSEKILDAYLKNGYYNSDLQKQSFSKTPARVVNIAKQDKASIDDFIFEINKSSFI